MLILLLPHQALFAAEHRLTPSLVARMIYDDNLLFQDSSGYEAVITPALQYRRETESGYMNLSGQGDIFTYPDSDNDKYDRINQKYQMDAFREANEYLALGLNSTAVFDHTFIELLEETGEVTEKKKRTKLSAGPSVFMALNPDLNARFQGNYYQVQYDSPEERDYAVYGGSFSLIQDLNLRTTASINLQYSRSDLDDSISRVGELMVGSFDQSYDMYQISLRFQRQQTKNFSFYFGGGTGYFEKRLQQRILEQDLSLPALTQQTIKEDHTDYLFEAGLEWLQEYQSFNLSCSRDVTQDAEGETLIRDRISMNASFSATEQMRFNTGIFFINSEGVSDDYKNDFGTQRDDVRAYGAFAELSYLLTEKSGLRLRYAFQYIDDEAENKTDDDKSHTRNRIWIEYSYQFSHFWD